MSSPEQRAASAKGRAFQIELSKLLSQHLGKATVLEQTSVLAVLMAEATRGACESGMPLETVLQAIRQMYAEYARQQGKP